MVQYSFKRDENGNLSKKGEYSEDLLTRTQFKYILNRGVFVLELLKLKNYMQRKKKVLGWV